MNTNHIDHQSAFTIPKLLKSINSSYKTAHVGKWGIDVDPSELGYDLSDEIWKKKLIGLKMNPQIILLIFIIITLKL